MIEGIKTESCRTAWAKIYIAGPKHKAEDVCRKWTERGACINLYETNYIYKYGEQTGIVVELINYPRFPRSEEELATMGRELGFELLKEMSQGSFTLQTNSITIYYDRRD
jgi:hypothetical protein